MKLIFKRIIVIFMLVCTLLSVLPAQEVFAGYVTDPETVLTVERAGNYASNFAINFYNNWNENSGYNSASRTIPNPSDDSYNFSNSSWIDFVYASSLKLDGRYYPSNNLSSSGTSFEEVEIKELADIMKIPGQEENEENGEKEEKDARKAIAELMNSGKILPGDILYTTEKEYLLYVGGTKVTYAAEPTAANTGAIKYEYIQDYFVKVNRKLMEAHEDEENYKPQYGVLNVYRIKEDFLNEANITDKNATMMFNNKGYYDQKNKYSGIPPQSAYAGSTHRSFFIDGLLQILKFLANLIMYMIRAVIVGWVNIFESTIQTIVLHLSGNSNPVSFIDKWTGVSTTSYAGTRITVESLLYNQVPLTDANFFNVETAGGFELLDESGEPISWLYTIRMMLAKWYFIIRNASIALMLIMLLYMVVRYLIASVPAKKADIKKSLVSWFIGFLIVLFIHYFMYIVLYCNDLFVKIIRDMSNNFASEAIGIESTEVTLYDAVRTKAYEFNFFDGTAGLILYIMLVYFFVRYLLIYLKRMVAIYVLALMGSFIGAKYAFDKASGRPSQSMSKWIKDFTFNVLLQTIHCLIYGSLMAVALKVAITSFSGLIIAILIMRLILNADKIVMRIFKVEAAFLEDVNKPETSYLQFITKYSLYKYMITAPFKFGKSLITGENKISQLFKYVKYYEHGLDDSDIKQKIDQENMKRKAWLAKNLYKYHLPIRYLNSRAKGYEKLYESLTKGGTYESQKDLFNALKVDKDLTFKKYTRPIDATKTILSGMFTAISAVGLLAEDGNNEGFAPAIHQAIRATKMFSAKDKDALSSYAKAHPGTAPGVLGDYQMQAAKAGKNLDKAISQSDVVEEIIDEELELNQLFNRIKGYGILTKEEAIKQIRRTIRACDTGRVPADVIKASVNRFLADNNGAEKVRTEDDVKEVLKHVNSVLRKKGSDVYLNDEMRDAIASSISGSLGAGLDVKECTSLLAETIATSNVVPVLARGKIENVIYKAITGSKFQTDNPADLPVVLTTGDTYIVDDGTNPPTSHTWDGQKWIETSNYTGGATTTVATIDSINKLQKGQLEKCDIVEVNNGAGVLEKYKYDGTSWVPYDDLQSRFSSSIDFDETRDSILHDKACEDGDLEKILKGIEHSMKNMGLGDLITGRMPQIRHAIQTEIGGNLNSLNGRSMEEIRDIIYDVISNNRIITRTGNSTISGDLEDISKHIDNIYAKNQSYRGKNKKDAVSYGTVKHDILERMEEIIQ